MILILIATFVAIFLPVVYFYTQTKHSYWKKRKVEQIEPIHWFYGNNKNMVRGNTSYAETYLEHYKTFRKQGLAYGGVYTLYSPVFMPIAPELIKDIIQKNFDHFSAHVIMRNKNIFSQNLFNAHGEDWRYTRKQLTPTFTSGKMKMMFETLFEKTFGLQKLAGEASKAGIEVNIKQILEQFTIDVVGSCGFGIDPNAINNPDSDFVRLGRQYFDPPKNKPTLFGLLLRALGKNRKLKIQEVEEYFKDLVEETVNYREKNNVYRKDFLHLLIQLKNRGTVSDDGKIFDDLNQQKKTTKEITVDYITAQCLIFYIAGYETSATTMSFAIFELTQNQEIQNKVRQEARDVWKKYNGKLTYDTQADLKYTENVIEETLRKYPPLSVIPRTCTKNYKIPGTEAIIEKGTMTFIPTLGIQTDPEYFPDPERFDPDRFNPENRRLIKDFTYFPFGEGPRMCLGMRFGMMQAKFGLMSLIKDYKFTLNEKTTVPITYQSEAFISSVNGGIWVNIHEA